jgi:hypothetical protein
LATTTFSGNVGIGTTTPSVSLSITGPTTGTSQAVLLTRSDNVPVFTVLSNGLMGLGDVATSDIMDYITIAGAGTS